MNDMTMNGSLTVNEIPYRLLRLLGKGKGGYSYLAECDGQQAVIKQIHHEPCDYYTFGNKIEAYLGCTLSILKLSGSSRTISRDRQ